MLEKEIVSDFLNSINEVYKYAYLDDKYLRLWPFCPEYRNDHYETICSNVIEVALFKPLQIMADKDKFNFTGELYTLKELKRQVKMGY